MYLKLTTPWSPGMNDPGKTYPCIYITQLTDNKAAANFQFIYEAGDFIAVADTENSDDAAGTTIWHKGPGMLAQVASVAGDDYIAATKANAPVATDSAYQSIYRILYTKLIGMGLAGTIVDS